MFLIILCLFQVFQVHGLHCGRVNVTQPLIRGGNVTHRTEWPFIVALYRINPPGFICGGTLISVSHVLTAAHCVHWRHNSVKLSGQDVEVRLGAHNLTTVEEFGAVKRNVTEIIVHPDWKTYGDSFDADLAILVLSENVSFSNFIQPICLPVDDVVVDGALIDVRGTVVGWGLTENNTHYNDVPKKAEAMAISNTLCYRTEPEIITSSSLRSFCAKGVDGTPNKGDSGGGFFVVSQGTWIQYGIVSAVRTSETGYADLNSLSIYVNIKSFKSWIVEIVAEVGAELGESTTRVTLDCNYNLLKYDFVGIHYTCQFEELEIRNEHNEVTSITGTHAANYQNDNVESIEFSKGIMYALPVELGKFFRNVIALVILSPLGLKYIWRSNFENLENLKYLALCNNDIEMLNDDCLWDLPNLEKFYFDNNKLREIPERFFDENRKLVSLDMSYNQLAALPKHVFQHNILLKELSLQHNHIKAINQITFERNIHLSHIDLSENQLSQLPKDLFRNNLDLKFLYLHGNDLEWVDEQMFEMNVKLIFLSLGSNRLEHLNENLFKNNVFLRYLGLKNNFISTLSGKIFEKNVNLLAIDLSHNKLEYLPNYLFEKNLLLQMLFIGNNFLKALDEKLFITNTELYVVMLNENQLEKLPRNLLRNTKLEILDIIHNKFVEIDGEAFDNNTNVILINLSFNRLTSLPNGLFINNFQLKEVLIMNNSIKSLNEKMFESNTKLQYVNLSSNEFQTIPKRLFQHNLNIKSIVITKGSLRTLDTEIFEKNGRLEAIILSSNQLEFLPKHLLKNNLLLKEIDLRANLLKAIDESMFETNVFLEKANFALNKIEYLPRNLFSNNALLRSIDFSNNPIVGVEIDFSKLQKIESILFIMNPCIDAVFTTVSIDFYIYRNHYNNLTLFQDKLSTTCYL
ncbi:Platelet glycoprotein V [Pseudolycoriella hygida]|uniref:Platelet glycoprotein V n=1 Tax=Pseudolycoriella hygida TaxID=35572 RepID=A0A9Q0RWZ7_9DIPT|nr:Platelet glycoprotein V [Pseudolycoriella hygida]